ncbi:MAG: CRTAC1 family protein [Rhodothermales bacterium]
MTWYFRAAGWAVLAGFASLAGGCAEEALPLVSTRTAPIVSPAMAPPTAEMTRELGRLFEASIAAPSRYYYLNSERAAEVLREMDGAPADRQSLLRQAYAIEQLYAGNTPSAIDLFEALLREEGGEAGNLSARHRKLLDFLAISGLRLGEQQNCIGNHAAEACIMPLQGGGIHTLQEGARSAIGWYETLLGTYQNDYRSRWLLNVAYMTLGRYPAGVPEPWRIPGLEPTPGPIPAFKNVAPQLGLDERRLAGSVAIEDFNEDGLLDLFVTAHRLGDSVILYLNDGDGGFVDATDAAGIAGLSGGLNVVHADYNNDGHADILILRGAWLGVSGAQPNSLLRGRGDGTFEDVTREAGLLSYHPTQAAAWADFNNDGWLDLYIGNELSNRWLSVWQQSTDTPADKANPSELYLNNGDGTFTDVAPRLGLDVSLFVKGVAWGDVNNDGLPDLYLSVLAGPNRLYINRGGTTMDDWRFEEVAGKAGVHEPFFSFPVWFWDFDNDGWEDLCVGNSDLRRLDDAAADLAREFLGLPALAEMPRLYRNNGDETFTDITAPAGMEHVLYAMGGNFGDLNNDGFEDAYFGTGAPDYRSLVPNRMFMNVDGRRVREVTFESGFGHLQKGHGIAFGDLDRDGDQDIYAVMGGAYEGDVFQDALFENPGVADAPAWIVVQLAGHTANRAAIGARLRFVVTRRNGERREIHRIVSTGGSFGSSSLQVEVGLGDAERLDRLEVVWPNAGRSTDVFEQIPLNGYYRVEEGGAMTPLTAPPVPFRKSEPAGHTH